MLAIGGSGWHLTEVVVGAGGGILTLLLVIALVWFYWDVG